MRRPHRAALLGLCAGVVLFAGRASATLVLALDLPTLVARADAIAVVDVAGVRSAWSAERRQILTTVDLVVVESWKGGASPSSHLTVVQMGGSVGDLVVTVDGMPRFSPGERALVFLRGQPDRAGVVGMSQGKRSLRRRSPRDDWWVSRPDREGADFVAGDPATATPVIRSRDQPLGQLRAEVGALVRQAVSP